MPLTPAGAKTMASMTASYGSQKAKKVFYSSINSGRLQKRKMEGTRSSSSGRSSGRRGSK